MNLHTHDLHFQGIPGVIAATTLESAGEIALIETGPGSCGETLLASLQAHGIGIRDVRKVFVTHIHLDHSGGAGWWAQQGAQIYVHERGAAHVIDPARLIDSAARIYGDQMETLWGDILPAPKENVHALKDHDTIQVGEIELTAWDTPGHARHHLCYLTGGTCFTGDVAGMRLADTRYLSVTSAPPQFEPDAYHASIDRLLAANLTELRLTHYGPVTDVQDHLTRYRQRIQQVTELLTRWHKEGRSTAEIAQQYHDHEQALAQTQDVTSEEWQKLEATNSTSMCASGIIHWVEKQVRRSGNSG